MQKANQGQLAYARIRELLVARVLEAGQRLKETEWAQSLNVNRADVREAFCRLLGEGLLVSGPKGGFFVRDFSSEDMQEVNFMRIVLESAAAELAVEKAQPCDIEELESIVKLMEALAENSYALGVFEADLHFHRVLIKAGYSKKLVEVYERANLPLSRSIKVPSTLSQEQLFQTAKLHRGMLEALQQRDKIRLKLLLKTGLTEEPADMV
ncbi:MAG: hypothetical protein A2Y07_06175 [Planctomycetes bacterium GWF2_50_10]|nr:MAG: hypothetical protein A2Y07_06175 [Planctomycetes bacterium GWF2_50_10]